MLLLDVLMHLQMLLLVVLMMVETLLQKRDMVKIQMVLRSPSLELN